MVTLIAVTAAVLAAILVIALAAILIFVMQIRAFMADTSAALDVVNDRASRLARRLEHVQRSTRAAAVQLTQTET